MPIVSGEIVRESRQMANTELDIQFQRALWMGLTSPIPSNGELSQTLHAYSGLDGLKEHIGEIELDRWIEKTRTVGSTPYSYGFAIEKHQRNTLFVRQTVSQKIREFAADAAMHPNGLLFDLLQSTTNTDTWDGLTFFNTAHPVLGAGFTFSNLISGTGTTEANIVADFESMRDAAAGIKKRNGLYVYENLEPIKWEIYHPLNLKTQMANIFKRMPRDGSATQGQFITLDVTLYPMARLADDDWYARIKNIPRTPFWYHQVQAIEFGWEPEYDRALKRAWTADARYKVVYGWPETMFKVDN